MVGGTVLDSALWGHWTRTPAIPNASPPPTEMGSRAFTKAGRRHVIGIEGTTKARRLLFGS